jgi:2'-5' RNA ligase
MRLFIAIPLSVEIKKALADCQEILKPKISGAKWVEPEGIHLTVKFLGETNERRVGDIAACCQRVVEAVEPFQISLSGIGGFPNLVIPRVIWVGISEGKEAVCQIARDLEASLKEIGFPKEARPFSPHLTLARIKFPKRVSLIASEPEIRKMKASSIQLIQSTLTPKGATYQVLKEIRFEG